MIQCLIKGKEVRVSHTHANNSGQITTFFYTSKGCGNVSPRSFNLADFNSVEDFLKSEYKAELIESLEY